MNNVTLETALQTLLGEARSYTGNGGPAETARRDNLRLAAAVLAEVIPVARGIDSDGYLGRNGTALALFLVRLAEIVNGRKPNTLRTILKRSEGEDGYRAGADLRLQWRKRAEETQEELAAELAANTSAI